MRGRPSRQQLPAPARNVLRTVLLVELQGVVHRRQQTIAVAAAPHRCGRLLHIARTAQYTLGANHGVERRSPCNRAVAGGTQAVDVGPCALRRSFAVVLLQRRVTGRDEDRHGLGAAKSLARRAKVQQYRAAVLAHVDVGRLDVAVDEARRVHQLQAIEDGQQATAQLLFAQRAAAVEQARQAFAFLVAHHHIGGVVGLEHRMHMHDVGVHKTRQRARLGEEALQAPGVALGLRFGARMGFCVGTPPCDFRRQVFLDRNAPVQIGVARQVGDAETALPQHVLKDIPVQAMACEQCVWIGLFPHGTFCRLARAPGLHNQHPLLGVRRRIAEGSGRRQSPRPVPGLNR